MAPPPSSHRISFGLQHPSIKSDLPARRLASFGSSGLMQPRSVILQKGQLSGGRTTGFSNAKAGSTCKPDSRRAWLTARSRTYSTPRYLAGASVKRATLKRELSESPDSSPATKRHSAATGSVVDCSDSDDCECNGRREGPKVTPTSSSDGSGDEKERGEVLRAELRALVKAALPRVNAGKRDKFAAHYNDDWIATNLANHKDPREFVDRFRRAVDKLFVPSGADEAAEPQVCDRCDGHHNTAQCPHFCKERDDHPDARKSALKGLAMGSDGGNAFLVEARVVQQPGDGSCLFHSLAYTYSGLSNDSLDASQLRALLMDWLLDHEDTKIADTPVRDWVKWDSGCTVAAYAKRMRFYGWGGGIEMAAFAHRFNVNVHVYERSHHHASFHFKRISRFEAPRTADQPARSTVTLLYRGGVHYDALIPQSAPVEVPHASNQAKPSKQKASPTHSFALSGPPSSPLWRDNLLFKRTSPRH